MKSKAMRVAALLVAVGVLSGLTGALPGAAWGDTTGLYDFQQQPSLTIANAAITPAVSVRTSFPAVPVELTLQHNLVRGAFACKGVLRCPFSLNRDGSVSMNEALDGSADGVATFTGLAITVPQPDYRLRAESFVEGVGPLFATSDEFTIADTATDCDASASTTSTTCSNTATSPSGFQTVTVVATDPDDWTDDASVGIAFYPYSTVFPTAAPVGCTTPTETVAPADLYGYFVDVEDDGNVVPTKTVTTNLSKAIVKPDPNNGVSHIDVCLGARNEDDPEKTFPAKTTGGVAKPDAQTNRFWGVLPNCSVPAPADPCVQSRRKDKAGNAIIVHVVPSPWDEYTHTG